MFIPLILIGLLLMLVSFFIGFEYKITSPVYLTLIFLYVITSSIKIFDIRLTQHRKFNGVDCGELPNWVGIIHYIDWAIASAMIILNWKLYLIVFILRFILKVIPVLESIGSFIMCFFVIPPKDSK